MRLVILFSLCCLSLFGQPRALVTGGAGFLGSHLCDRLIAEGYAVVCLDNLQTSTGNNVAHLKCDPNFAFVQRDVIEPLDDLGHFDAIYNMACPASPPLYQKDPIHTLKTSVLGMINVLNLAERCHARVFQASTSEVYGDPEEHPQSESYWGHVNPIGIRACYDEGKRCAETLCFEYHRIRKVAVKVGRIFNTYGPRISKDDGRVVPNFILQALKGEPLTIYGDGTQTRSFCYVDDLIEAIYRFMQTDDRVTGPFNLGNDGEFTMRELAEQIISKTGSLSQVVYLPLPKDDPTRRRPNLEKTGQALNWSPRVSLEEGLERTIFYFESVENNF